MVGKHSFLSLQLGKPGLGLMSWARLECVGGLAEGESQPG